MSSAPDYAGGSFKVTTRTSNGPLTVKFLAMPAGSVLYYEGSTGNGPVNIKIHPTFEGEFTIQTSRWCTPSVETDNTAVDPRGRGRRRVVQLKETTRSGVASGTVRWWPLEDMVLGSINVKTSNGPTNLIL